VIASKNLSAVVNC